MTVSHKILKKVSFQTLSISVTLNTFVKITVISLEKHKIFKETLLGIQSTFKKSNSKYKVIQLIKAEIEAEFKKD